MKSEAIQQRIDPLERKLLALLDADSRLSIAAAAKKLRCSRDLLVYRFERLQERGILRGCTAVVDPYKLGFVIYKTYFRLASDRQRVRQLVNEALRHPRAYWVAECSGSWDLIISFFAAHPREFHALQDHFLSRYNDIILSFGVYTIVDITMFQKKFLGGSGSHTSVAAIGGNPGNYIPDEVELKLLRILSENARIPVTEIAARVGVTPIMVSHRVRRMEEEQVIVAYRTQLELNLLGMEFFKAQLDLLSYSEEYESQLRNFCAKQAGVSYFIRQIGECKLELEIECEGFAAFNQLVDALRERFSAFIRHIDTVFISREHFCWNPEKLHE